MKTKNVLEQPIFQNVRLQTDAFNFYYVNGPDEQRLAVIMVGVKDGLYARGISICSSSEKPGFNKATGIQYAASRMLKAFKHRRNEQDISTTSFKWSVQDFESSTKGVFEFKVEYNAKLTDHEKYIMTKAYNNGN